jgi:acetyltransferase-like isoleucine patch superfamily enzyme
MPFFSIIKNDMTLSNIFYKMMGTKSKGFFSIGAGAKIADPWYIEIGKNVIISIDCLISCHVMEKDHIIIVKIKIGDNVTIGYAAGMGPGTEIGNSSILGAGSITAKFTKISSDELWIGCPARFFKKIN